MMSDEYRAEFNVRHHAEIKPFTVQRETVEAVAFNGVAYKNTELITIRNRWGYIIDVRNSTYDYVIKDLCNSYKLLGVALHQNPEIWCPYTMERKQVNKERT